MKVKVGGIEGKYDNRNLTVCKCGKHHYPSKKMFAEFLKQFKDVKADVNIISVEDLSGVVVIYVELKYKISSRRVGVKKQ